MPVLIISTFKLSGWKMAMLCRNGAFSVAKLAKRDLSTRARKKLNRRALRGKPAPLLRKPLREWENPLPRKRKRKQNGFRQLGSIEVVAKRLLNVLVAKQVF